MSILSYIVVLQLGGLGGLYMQIIRNFPINCSYNLSIAVVRTRHPEPSQIHSIINGIN